MVRELFLLMLSIYCLSVFSPAHSLESLDPHSWLSFEVWERQQGVREFVTSPKESMGRLISCIGECRLYRGPNFILGGAHSAVYEGDEMRTLADSYAWIFFWDGSLIRISPRSAITLKEFNVSHEGFFLFLRLDRGHVYLANRRVRHPQGLVEEKGAETDQFFLPLPQTVLREDEPLSEPLFFRPTWNLITMANGSFYGKGLQVNAFYQEGGESFIQQVKEREAHFFLQFWPRGYDEGRLRELQDKRVYRVDPMGGRIQESQHFFFAKSNLVIKRIPSILLVREQWLRRYAKVLHSREAFRGEQLKRHGFRLWQGWGEGKEMARRIEFLRTFNRRAETAYNYMLHRVQKSRAIVPQAVVTLPHLYYEKPYRHYIRSLDRRDIFK